jgi:hypothetical protein
MGLILNFSPIQFDDREITVGRLPYRADGEQVLRQLRAEHNDTHVFRREGAESILAVSVLPDAQLIGKAEIIRLKEHLGLAAALIRNAILNHLVGLGWQVFSYEPMNFVAGDDLLRASLFQGITVPDWIGVRPLYELAIRPISFFGQQPFIIAALDVRTTRFVERTVAGLIADGFSVEGCYVGTLRSTTDRRIAPHIDTIGCVVSTEGTRLRLTDSRDGIETVEANDAWPEKQEFGKCLRHLLRERAPGVVAALQRQCAALNAGSTRLDRIKGMLSSLGSEPRQMIPGLTFTFGPLLDSTQPLFPRLETARRPVYVFDDIVSKTHTSHDAGLNEHGPYSARVFHPSIPRICVICHKSNAGQMKNFLQKLLHGMNQPSNDQNRSHKNYFKEGFIRKYALDDVDCEIFTTDDNSVASYREACKRAIRKAGSPGNYKWDLALVQIEAAFRHLAPRCNPYLVTRMGFYLHQIPVQAVKIETTQQCAGQLSCSLNNIALAMYAKLDGTPWLLKSASEETHELVIGLGCADVGSGRFGARERHVGITTVFSTDGNYYLYNTSKAVDMVDYRKELLRSLEMAILEVRAAVNWQPKNQIRLIFHSMFKQFSRDEIESVKRLVGGFKDCDVRYAFVELKEDHPYVLFDTDQRGVQVGRGLVKGLYAPVRGSYLQLGDRAVLLSLTGPKEVKRAEHGTPRPLLLSLHRDSSFTDMVYITEQIFSFSWHSWRTFLPASLPVTIGYSNLIANGLGHLSRLERWNPDVMLGQIGRGRWFL